MNIKGKIKTAYSSARDFFIREQKATKTPFANHILILIESSHITDKACDI